MAEATPIPIRRLDSTKLVTAPYQYIDTLLDLTQLATLELEEALRERDKEQVQRVCRKLRSIGALAEIASESL